jgi:hypothetical protein
LAIPAKIIDHQIDVLIIVLSTIDGVQPILGISQLPQNATQHRGFTHETEESFLPKSQASGSDVGTSLSARSIAVQTLRIAFPLLKARPD